jgi:phage gp36-like protein
MYASLSDLIDAYGDRTVREWTDLDRAGSVDAGRAARALADASAEVDAYAQSRHVVPFAPPPPLIRKLTVDIAAWNLLRARGYDPQSADRSVFEAYTQAAKLLERLARGELTLGVPQPAKDFGAQLSGAQQVFSRSSLEGL